MAAGLHRAALASASPYQQAIWTAALETAGLAVQPVEPPDSMARLAAPQTARIAGTLAVIDVQRITAESLELLAFGEALAESGTVNGPWIATLGTRIPLAESERALLRSTGALDVLPFLDHRDAASLRQLSAALSLAGLSVDTDRLRQRLDAIPPARVPAPIGRLHAAGDTVQGLVGRMMGIDGVARADRRYAGRTYPDCFVGAEALDWLARALAASREAALEVGQFLLEHGVFHHVVKDHPLRDAHLFYRFSVSTPALEAIALDELARQMWSPGGPTVATRTYHGKSYDDCFVGAEAVDWIARRYALSREEALELGQKLINLGLVHHVVDEHPFRDGHYFFRFRRHEYA